MLPTAAPKPLLLTMLQVTSYCRGLQPECYLEFGQRLYPLSSSFITKSSVLESQLRSATKAGPGGKAVLALDSTQLQNLQHLAGPLSPLGVERFLAALSGAALEHSCSGASLIWSCPPFAPPRRKTSSCTPRRQADVFEARPAPHLPTAAWLRFRPPTPYHLPSLLPFPLLLVAEVEQVVQILKLADWFGAHELRDRCDSRLCQLLYGLSNRQQISDSREEAAACALEAGIQHCLTKTGACCNMHPAAVLDVGGFCDRCGLC